MRPALLCALLPMVYTQAQAQGAGLIIPALHAVTLEQAVEHQARLCSQQFEADAPAWAQSLARFKAEQAEPLGRLRAAAQTLQGTPEKRQVLDQFVLLHRSLAQQALQQQAATAGRSQCEAWRAALAEGGAVVRGLPAAVAAAEKLARSERP